MVVLLNTLFINDHQAHVSVESRSLVVRVDRRLVGRFPIEALSAVVLTGKATMSTDAIGRCIDAGIRISSLKANGRLRFVVSAPTHGNVLLRTAQHAAARDPDLQVQLARTFAAAKLQNCRKVLARWASDSSGLTRRHLLEQRDLITERIEGLHRAQTPDAVRGFEGDATRRFFKGLGAYLDASPCDLSFELRTRRPPRDPVNALLGFAYGLALTEVIGGLESVGLDPQVGFLHQLRPGRPSLALDMLEEFRPLVDRFAVGVLTRRMLRADDFVRRAGGACYLTNEGRQRTLALWDQHRKADEMHQLLDRCAPRAHLPVLQATLLARVFRGDLPAYPPFVLTA